MSQMKQALQSIAIGDIRVVCDPTIQEGQFKVVQPGEKVPVEPYSQQGVALLMERERNNVLEDVALTLEALVHKPNPDYLAGVIREMKRSLDTTPIKAPSIDTPSFRTQVQRLLRYNNINDKSRTAYHALCHEIENWHLRQRNATDGFARNQWWVKEIRNSLSLPGIPDELKRACVVATKLFDNLLPARVKSDRSGTIESGAAVLVGKELRDVLGRIISQEITHMITCPVSGGKEEVDWFDANTIDIIADAVMTKLPDLMAASRGDLD